MIRKFRWRGDRTDASYSTDPTEWWADSTIIERLGQRSLNCSVKWIRQLCSARSRGERYWARWSRLTLALGWLRFARTPARRRIAIAGSSLVRPGLSGQKPAPRCEEGSSDRRPAGAPDRRLDPDRWQAVGARSIVEQSGAAWCGAAVIVDGLSDSRLRRDLGGEGTSKCPRSLTHGSRHDLTFPRRGEMTQSSPRESDTVVGEHTPPCRSFGLNPAPRPHYGEWTN